MPWEADLRTNHWASCPGQVEATAGDLAIRFISRFYLISPEVPALSHHKAKLIRKEQTFDPEFLPNAWHSPNWTSLTHMPTPEWRTVTREGPWPRWLKCNIRVESYTLWGWESERMDHHKQTSKQSQEISTFEKERGIAAREENVKCPLHPIIVWSISKYSPKTPVTAEEVEPLSWGVSFISSS